MKPFATRLITVVGLISAVWIAPTQAQDVVYKDGSTAVSCLAETEGFANMRHCIGRMAYPCMQPLEDKAAQANCLKVELDFWEGKLNDNYESLRAELQAVDASSPHIDALDVMQRAWGQYRDARCDYIADGYQNTNYYSNVVYQCLMATTAEQALVLEEMLY